MKKQKKFISNYNLSSKQEAQFQDIRSRIDLIDEELLNLLAKRTEIIKEAKNFKSSFYPNDKCYITPGRESSMMKAIIDKSKKTDLPPEAIMNIWRNIISSSTSVEKELKIKAYLKSNEYAQFLDANNYFGSFANITTYDNINELLETTADTSNAVAVVPYYSDWWAQLSSNFSQLKIFACLPFIANFEASSHRSAIIANILPEPTDDDITLFVLKINKDNVAANREIDNKFSFSITQRICDNNFCYYLLQKNGYYQKHDKLNLNSNVINVTNIGTFSSAIAK